MNFKIQIQELSEKVEFLLEEYSTLGNIEIDFCEAERNFHVSRSKLYKDIERGVISRTESGKLALIQLKKNYQLRSKRWNKSKSEN